MKRILISLVILYSLSGFAYAEVDVFAAANKEYKEGRYQEAIRLYEELQTGHPYASVYYNLGNAYAKSGDFGKAILNFERARRLNPRDPEILSNLNYVNSLLEHQVEDKRPAILVGLSATMSSTSRAELSTLALIFYALWIVVYIVYLLLKRPAQMKRWVVILFLLFLAFAVAVALKYSIAREEDAFVTAKSADVKYGPSEQDKTAFKLSAGMPVFINNERDSWARIELRDGTGGWISNKLIEKVHVAPAQAGV